MFTCFEGQIVYYKYAMEEITIQTELTKISYCHHTFVRLLLVIGFQAVGICLQCCNAFLVLLVYCSLTYISLYTQGVLMLPLVWV